MATKAENKRKASQPPLVGKVVHLESIGKNEYRDGEYFCVRESERSIFCVPVSRQPKHTFCGEWKFVLDRREPNHYVVTETRDDPEMAQELIIRYAESCYRDDAVTDEVQAGLEGVLRTLCRVTGLSVPRRIRERVELTCVENGEVIFSRKMEALIRTYFCSDYQKKVNPVLKQLALEIFTSFQRAFEERNVSVTVIEPERKELPAGRPLLYLPE